MSARRALLALVCVAALACAPRRGRADEPEPPPEAGDGDYALERADTTRGSEFETDLSAGGKVGGTIRRTQRVSFRDGSSDGSFLDGDDPLAGGHYRAEFAGGALGWGRLAPRWGRGLLLGAASEPWSSEAADRGARAAFRGRAGDGGDWASADGTVEALVARFGRRTLAGARAYVAGYGLGVLAGEGGAQASLARAGDGGEAELAADPRGRWRAEGALLRQVSANGLTLRARGGHVAFRSLAEPARSGPPLALAATDAWSHKGTRVLAHGSLWSWRTGADGARAALEVRQRLVHHAGAAAGFEEQHGARREPSVQALADPIGMRQGVWTEWTGAAGPRLLTLRHELWGERAFAHGAVRRLLGARIETPLPRGTRLSLAHAVWFTAHGERLYLPEDDVDRVTLRALTGAGTRTRIDLAVPLLGGRARLAAIWTEPETRASAPTWSVTWSRRTRGSRRPSGQEGEP